MKTKQRGMVSPYVIAIIAFLVLGAGGFYYATTQTENDAMEKDGEVMEKEGDAMMEKEGDAMMKEDGAMMEYSGEVIAGSKTPLLDFTKADYEVAVASGKLVVLYYYANWCPICKAETQNSLYPAFDELSNENVIGFRVNYKDTDTDADEEALAREHGIAYQHTKVFVKNGERILKSPEEWDKARYLSEIANASK